MSTKLIIKGGPEKPLYSINLKHVLGQVAQPDNYFWKILYFEGVMNPGISILEIENYINNSIDGRFYSVAEMIELSNDIADLHWILVIGSKNRSKLIRYNDDLKMYKNCDFTIELFDSSQWEIITEDLETIDLIQLNFEGVSQEVVNDWQC